MKPALLIALAATLAACASPGGGNGPYAPTSGSQYERQVIGALSEIKVSEEQRQTVLGAYDALAPKLKHNDAEDARVQRRWEALDPRAAGYLAQAETVAEQAGTLDAERFKALAQFNQTVATALDASQWATWSRVMNDQRAAFENGRRLDPTFRPGER